MLRKLLFITAHSLYNSKFYRIYQQIQKNQWKQFEVLKKGQESQLKNIIKFSYNNVPYYRDLFDNLDLLPDEVQKVKDLEKLPILTKEIIKDNQDKFIPENIGKIKYVNKATSGSTGKPLKYRITKFERILQMALRYRSWSISGYSLGDKVVILGGSSVMPGKKNRGKDFFNRIFRNFLFLSSFGINDKKLEEYADLINTLQPKIGYGYAGAWYLFAKFLERKNLKIHTPKAIYTTAEKLLPEMRDGIESVFGAEVYDCYGLNDGGISAYECPLHTGLHINTESGILEVVDEKGFQIEEGRGKILATSLHNYAMPFIRYDTGDLGYLIRDSCRCGRGYRLLKEVIGRQQEFLITPEGNKIHGEFFSHIFREVAEIKEFQAFQDEIDSVSIRIKKDVGFKEKQLGFIERAIKNKSPKWKVEFEFVEKIETTPAGKYKFVINRIKNND
jgi:phenylacetate-CoA ligase